MATRVAYIDTQTKLIITHSLLDNNLGVTVATLSPDTMKYSVKRLDDNSFFDFSDNTFKVEGSVVTFFGTLTEESATNLPGEFSVKFPPVGNLDTSPEYLVRIFVSAGIFKFDSYLNFFPQAKGINAIDVWNVELVGFADYKGFTGGEHKAGTYLKLARQGVSNVDTTREADNGKRILRNDSGGILVQFVIKDAEDNVITDFPLGVPTQRDNPTFS